MPRKVICGIAVALTLVAPSLLGDSVGAAQGPGSAVPPGGPAPSLLERVLDLEARTLPVSEEVRATLARVVDAAVASVRPPGDPPRTTWNRRDALAALGRVDRALIEMGFLYPQTEAVDSLSACLVPFHLSSGQRGAYEKMPANARRRPMIEARFPGPFMAADCDTASLIYLAVGERLNLPLRLVLLPSGTDRVAHAFVRWRLGGRFLDWETNEGHERRDESASQDWRAHFAQGSQRALEVEVEPAQVPGFTHYVLAVIHERNGEWEKALGELTTALEVLPTFLDAQRRFAWNTATAPNLISRDHRTALTHSRSVLRRTGDADARDTLAAVLASMGDFPAAVAEQRKAVAAGTGSVWERSGYRHRLNLYQRGLPYRQPAGESAHQAGGVVGHR